MTFLLRRRRRRRRRRCRQVSAAQFMWNNLGRFIGDPVACNFWFLLKSECLFATWGQFITYTNLTILKSNLKFLTNKNMFLVQICRK